MGHLPRMLLRLQKETAPSNSFESSDLIPPVAKETFLRQGFTDYESIIGCPIPETLNMSYDFYSISVCSMLLNPQLPLFKMTRFTTAMSAGL